jgi:hypothetical protein
MKRKTIRLDSDIYSLIDGVVKCLVVDGSPNYDEPWMDEYVYVPTTFSIGTECVLMSRTNVSPNAIRSGRDIPEFYLSFETAGIPGNMNSNIRRYHGWRGTTNDISHNAHGLRKIISVGQLKNGTVTVTVGDDILPDEA